MESFNTIAALRQQLHRYRAEKERIAFVPTMGNLHEGHLELVRQAARRADRVVVSIYVNPTQFGADEDFDSYPRTLERDRTLLQQEGSDLLFLPTDGELYGEGLQQLRVVVEGVSEHYCGASRPGHFSGVATVVAKLFNIVQPDIALFGEKDYQQLLVIRQLVAALHFPLEVVGVPTVRERDGLAMSSRNGYLSSQQRRIAPHLHLALVSIMQQLRQGERDLGRLCHEGKERLRHHGFRVDYLALADADTLEPAVDSTRHWVVLAAAFLGKTRLIDNCLLDLR